MVSIDIFDGLFVQHHYDGRSSVYLGIIEKSYFNDWQVGFLDCLSRSYDLDNSQFFIGSSGRAFAVFGAAGWRFRFFNPLEFDKRSVYDFRVFSDGRVDFLPRSGFPVSVCNWFQLYLSYLSDFHSVDVARILFRSWDGNLYRVFAGEDWLGFSLSLIRYGIDAVSVSSVQSVEVS